MKKLIAIALLVAAGCNQTSKKISLPELLATGKWVDLSYDFSEKTLYWPNNPTGFKLDTQFNGVTPAGFYYASNSFFTP